jgi:hypothetical protein
VVPIREGLVAEGHCTRINNPGYRSRSPNNEQRNLSVDINENFDLGDVCRSLGLEDVYRLALA